MEYQGLDSHQTLLQFIMCPQVYNLCYANLFSLFLFCFFEAVFNCTEFKCAVLARKEEIDEKCFLPC